MALAMGGGLADKDGTESGRLPFVPISGEQVELQVTMQVRCCTLLAAGFDDSLEGPQAPLAIACRNVRLRHSRTARRALQAGPAKRERTSCSLPTTYASGDWSQRIDGLLSPHLFRHRAEPGGSFGSRGKALNGPPLGICIPEERDAAALF
ncbi:hypothetical protein GQ53DRAFT_773961 [Thozetella sp. PMI_491]|nr:hypothetical protein GQ53DRAFT_773961 [Thozetella sp. PMI_491]